MNTDEHRWVPAYHRARHWLRDGGEQCTRVRVSRKSIRGALAHELRKKGLAVQQQHPVWVLYDGGIVGEYRADLVVNDLVVVEVKAAKAIDPVHAAQVLNYLKATRLKVGLLLNFGTPRLGIRRFVY